MDWAAQEPCDPDAALTVRRYEQSKKTIEKDTERTGSTEQWARQSGPISGYCPR